MKDQKDLEFDVADWIHNFLDLPNGKLEGFKPCPYSGMAKWRAEIGTEPLRDLVKLALAWDDKLDVVVLGYDPAKLDPHSFEVDIEQANLRILIPIDLLALEDHPQSPESVNGVSMNIGNWAIVLVQRFSKIRSASRSLKKLGYYQSWSQDYYNRVVGWRESYEHAGIQPIGGYLDDRAKYSDLDLSSNNYPSRTQNLE